MARRPEPWWWKQRHAWFVTIDGVRHSLGPDEDDARQRFHELMAEPRKRRVSPSSVVAICDAYVDWVEKHRSPDTYRWYKDRLQRFVESIPPTLRVAQLRPFHVQQFIDEMEGLSSCTKRNYVQSVKRAMAWAEEQGYIDRSPITHMKKPRAGRREIVVTEAEVKALLAATRDQEFRDLVSFSWHTGARAAESLALEARHGDLTHNRIVFPVEEEKMERAPRVIYLNDAAMEIVKRLVEKYPEGKLFRNTDGVPWTPDAANCRFQTLVKKIGRKVCLTDFRHTWMNRLLLGGVDGITVAVLAGHSDVSMLSKTYQHLSMNSEYLLGQVQIRVAQNDPARAVVPQRAAYFVEHLNQVVNILVRRRLQAKLARHLVIAQQPVGRTGYAAVDGACRHLLENAQGIAGSDSCGGHTSSHTTLP